MVAPSPTLTPPPTVTPPPKPRGKRWQWLVAPLLGMSLVLHGALLFIPLPSFTPVAEEEEEAPTEMPEVMSLTAIDELPPLEEAPPPPPEAPADRPPPAPGQAPPPRPEQLSADTPLPDDTPAPEEDFLDPAAPPEPPPDSGAFDPARAQARAGAARSGALQGEFGGINSDPGLVAESIRRGWPGGINQGCFFSSLDGAPQVAAGAVDALFFTRSYDFVFRDEIPRLFGAEVVPQGDYCGAALLEVRNGGVTEVFLSVIPIGPGNPAGTAAVVVWSQAPQ